MGSNITAFPNGVGQYFGLAKGGTAGNRTVIGGVAAGDRVLKVMAAKFAGTTALISTILDLTAQFAGAATAANTINNTGGTNTTGYLLFVQFADADAAL